MFRWLAAGLVALALLAGCSGGDEASAPQPTAAAEQAETAAPPGTTAPPPATTGESGEPGSTTEREPTTDRETMERVVRAWSDNLNAGDNDAVARLFALPALIAQGDQVGEFRSYEDIAAWHSGLPCSGRVVSITYDETDVALAVFELGDRATSACDAPGALAAARFVFRDGKLVVWQQVPVPGEEQPGATTELQA